MNIQQKLQQFMTQKISAVKEAGIKFLEENKKRPGVITLPDGLQYEILTKGTGPVPKATDTVQANYMGTLINGEEFDNSYKRGQPLTIPVSGVIRGWTEALEMMPVGSKWKLFIPSDLGYGDRGAGGAIPGGSALIFEIELLNIVNK
jgi:FKBP-type peptidyl-prolyl cis-trans isomerase FklB